MRFSISFGAALLAALCLVSPATAITIPVTITTDTVANDTECSLREAVTAAASNGANPTDCLDGESPGLDTIQLGAGTHLIGGAAGEDSNASGDLDVGLNSATGPLTIDGAGASATSIDANDSDRVIDASINNSQLLTITDLTVTDGAISSSAGAGIDAGGGPGTFTITDAVVTANTLGGTAGTGAGVSASVTLNMTRTRVSGNQMNLIDDAVATQSTGGGLVVGATATIVDSEIVDNGITTADPSDPSRGGGIGTGNAGSDLTVSGTTIAGNSLSGGLVNEGGGIDFQNSVGPDKTLRITNTTLSGNSVGGSGTSTGGGMHVEGGIGSIAHTTFTGNSAGAGDAMHRGSDAGSSLTVRGSILAEGGVAECAGQPVASGGYNVVEGTSCNFAATGDEQGVDPALLPLGANGGPGESHALPATSPAVDKVPVADCDDAAATPLTADQRGEVRPFPAGGTCDSGAFELQETCLNREATIIGTGSANTLLGTATADVILAQGGDDTITPGAGDDRVCGGTGVDTVSFAGGPRVTADLGAGTATGQGTDVLLELEQIVGTSFGDLLLGDGLANRLTGGAGRDTLKGKGGADALLGGAGRDKLLGGGGRDSLNGGNGRRDLCNGGAGRDRRKAKGCERRRKLP